MARVTPQTGKLCESCTRRYTKDRFCSRCRKFQLGFCSYCGGALAGAVGQKKEQTKRMHTRCRELYRQAYLRRRQVLRKQEEEGNAHLQEQQSRR